MRIPVFFILALIPFTLFGQNIDELKDGYQQFKYPNGVVSSEGIIKNGKPDGFWKSYYVTGIIKSEGKRRSYLLDSIWVFYDQAGDTLEKISYQLGKKNGYYYKYQKDPIDGLFIVSRELYAGDLKEGVAEIYYPEGKIRQTIPYFHGKKDGLSREYDRNGNVITLLEYNNDFMISREKINYTDNAGLKQGKWLDFYNNGNIKAEKNFLDDQLHGYYKEYSERGKLIVTLLYDNGKVTETGVGNGTEIEVTNRYDNAGKLIYSGPFKEGIPVGIHREYNETGGVKNAKIYGENGILLSEGIVDEAGNRNGPWKDFLISGSVSDEGQYNNNRRTGTWKFYGPNGKIEQLGAYNNGRIEGTWRWYYPDGELLREEDYYQGKREGNYTEYTKNGDIIAQGQYTEGERNGEWKYKNGDNTETGNYILGLRDGSWKAFYPDGNLRFKGDYVQGNADGRFIFFYESGKMKEERFYKNGLKTKTWKKYSETGEILLTITYRDDIEVSVNGVKISLPESDVKLIK